MNRQISAFVGGLQGERWTHRGHLTCFPNGKFKFQSLQEFIDMVKSRNGFIAKQYQGQFCSYVKSIGKKC